MKRMRRGCAAFLAALFLTAMLPLPALAEGVEADQPAVQQESSSQPEITNLEESAELEESPAPALAESTELEESPVPAPAERTEPEESPAPALAERTEPEESPAPAPAESTEPEESPVPAPAESTEPEESPILTPAESTEPGENPLPAPAESAEPEESPAPAPAESAEPGENPLPAPTESAEPEESPAPSPPESIEPETAPSPEITPVPEAFSQGGISTYSLIPLETVRIETLSLESDHLPAEKSYMPVEDIVQKIDEYLIENGQLDPDSSILRDGDQIMWTIGSQSDDYQLLREGDTLDLTLTEHYFESSFYSYVSDLELIVGRLDQLNRDNRRYQIGRLELPMSLDALDFEVYTGETPGERAEVAASYLERLSVEETVQQNWYTVAVDPSVWEAGTPCLLSMELKKDYPDGRYEAAVYEGYYETEAEAQAAGARDLTSQIWAQDNLPVSGGCLADYSYREGGNISALPYVTLVLKRGAAVQAIPFRIMVYQNMSRIFFSGGLWEQSGSGGRTQTALNIPDSSDGISVLELDLTDSISETYYLGMEFDGAYPAEVSADRGLSSVKKAVVGFYETEEAAALQPDIKADLFSDPETGGYPVDFSQNEDHAISFTVFGTHGEILHKTIRLSHRGYQIRIVSLYAESRDGSGSRTNVHERHDYFENGSEVDVVLKPSYLKDGCYYLGLNFDYPDGASSDHGLSNVKYAALGSYEAEAQVSAQPDIKADLFSDPETRGYLADFSQSGSGGTLDFTAVDLIGRIYRFKISLYQQILPSHVGFEGICVQTEEWGRQSASGTPSTAPESGEDGVTVRMYRAYPAEGQYYLGLFFYDGTKDSAEDGLSKVIHAALGTYASADEVRAQPDIKNDLFSAPQTGGYLADFRGSGALSFTILGYDENGEEKLYPITIRLVDPLPSDSVDLIALGAQDAGGSAYQTYAMQFDDDSYYRNGYQTIFLLRANGTGGTGGVPVSERTIVPLFTAADVTHIYGSIGGTGAPTQQISGRTAVAFQSGQVVQYSTSAENQKNADNYWITFVTQEEGPKLFVNAVNYAGHYNSQGQPVREVFLDEAHGYEHDIFLANIGDEALTGLSVTLSDAQNIALDEYWTIGETKTLAAFTTVEDFHASVYGSRQGAQLQGELYNVAKIRLIPNGDANGSISGTLTISADGQEPVVIQLTGISGVPKIMTSEIPDGVKYVPYSSFIQTNVMDGVLKFELEEGSTLPEGVEVRPNGEIYGVPRESGEFTFSIRASYDLDQSGNYEFFDPSMVENYSSTTEFTLSVLDNTDENVEGATDEEEGYGLSIRVPDMTDFQDQVFESEGSFGNFIDFWLDGEKLILGEDYDAEEGSTRITIHAKTFQKYGTGAHTIAAEFRQNKSVENPLRRTAQNYELTVSGGGTGGGSGTGTGGGTGGGSGTGTGGSTGGGSGTGTGDSTGGGSGTGTGGSTSGGSGTSTGGSTGTGSDTDSGEREHSSVVVSPGASQKPVQKPVSTPDPSPVPNPSPDPNPAPDSNQTQEAEPSRFRDVARSNWCYSEVEWAYENGLMLGAGDSSFAPEAPISQAMIVTVLARLAKAGLDEWTASAGDGAPESWYGAAAAWAGDSGILSGESFQPDVVLSRGGLAGLLVRYLDTLEIPYALPETPVLFADRAEMDPEEERAFQILYHLGIFKGKGGGVMDPNGSTTRAELAALLHRLSLFSES